MFHHRTIYPKVKNKNSKIIKPCSRLSTVRG